MVGSRLKWSLGIGFAVAGVTLVFLRRHFAGGVCRSETLLTDKTVIITGANTGIGKETAIELAKRKAKVILACRNPDRGREAERDIRLKSGSEDVVYRHLDLASLSSVRQFAETILQEESHIDILINNAGIMACPQWKTEDGFEMQFGVNHLGHFLLTNLLLDRLKEAPSARIINVASLGYKYCKEIKFDDLNSERDYDPHPVYYHSKLANVLFTRELARRLKGSNVTANCLHPGVIWTELGRHFMPNISTIRKAVLYPILMLTFKTPYQGAQTTICCAVSEELAGVSGKYFADCKEKELATEISQSDEAAEKLWKASAQMVGLQED